MDTQPDSGLPSPRFFLRWNLPEAPSVSLTLTDTGETIDLTEFAAILIGLGATLSEHATDSQHSDSDVLIGEVAIDVPDDVEFELWSKVSAEPQPLSTADACVLLAAAVRAMVVEGVTRKADELNSES